MASHAAARGGQSCFERTFYCRRSTREPDGSINSRAHSRTDEMDADDHHEFLNGAFEVTHLKVEPDVGIGPIKKS